MNMFLLRFGSKVSVKKIIATKKMAIIFLFLSNANLFCMDQNMASAIRSNDVAAVRNSIRAGVNLNQQDDLRHTLLMHATMCNNTAIVEILLDAGAQASVNVQSLFGNTALMVAATHNNVNVVRSLLRARAYVNLRNNDGETALTSAAAHNSNQVIPTLLDAGANLNMRDTFGQTALMYAIMQGNFDMIRSLLVAGADLTIPDRNGNIACRKATFSQYRMEVFLQALRSADRLDEQLNILSINNVQDIRNHFEAIADKTERQNDILDALNFYINPGLRE